ncbi:glyoxylase-like metal-dependent hydrolase (beta-lactamase superfamily II) [Paenibacillus sp. BK033]|uniref:MBL fold metallo-hydrolase n=1 Tax=Paenibacillus sp. BK033 TaxID=2512133 RepID=UPI0010520334|nr:MBL fold metallo-hydrolase [Paenibacillus sp. BK033]TCM97720.1 glyoxylase-like metal-dependent hydrolase (beta-lactamase superfamily II) [Paenibacillus sp. BK033]
MTVETKVWDGGWIQAKIPLPFSLKWVNSYLISEEDGTYTVIDPGLHTDEALAAWEEVFLNHALTMEQIKRIVLTHQHPDHYGLAGYFQERTGAPVYISERSHGYTRRLWGESSTYADELRAHFAIHGMPDELTLDIKNNLDGFVRQVSPQPEVTYLKAGGTIRLGGTQWQMIDAPGHAFGQLCFYEPDKELMLCGDQVLPHITPNIAFNPGEEEDPLGCFLSSLDELSGYKVKLAFPGHREPFAEFANRIQEIKQHHTRRLDKLWEMLRVPNSAFEVCEHLFGGHLRTNPHNLRFAMSETIAHLHYLEKRGKLIRTGTPDTVMFRTAE